MVITDYLLPPYVIAFVTAIVSGFLLVYFMLKRIGIPRNIIGYSILLNIILMLYGAKIYTIFTSGFKVGFWNSGMSSLGGVIGILLGIFLFGCIYKESRALFFEVYVVVVPLMYGIAKIGCFLAGCCKGIPYDGFLSVTYQNRSIQGGPYFPIQLVESIVFVIIFLIVFGRLFHKKSSYTVPTVLISCAIAKFSLDFLREEHIGKFLSVNQYVCIGFFVWGITIFFKKRRRLRL